MRKFSFVLTLVFCSGFITIISSSVNAATINFFGDLAIIDIDDAGVYAGTAIGTSFSGFIDDETFNGMITDGTSQATFGCCIAAGGLSLSNDFVINSEDAALFNQLSDSDQFNAGDVLDGVNIEGDSITSGGGRIEIGLSYILSPNAFNSPNPGNYPFEPNDVLLTLFFILEEDSNGVDIYSALGVVNPVPIPASLWLFMAGFLSLFSMLKHPARQ